MSKNNKKKKSTSRAVARSADAPLQFGMKAGILGAAGFACLVAGYALLAQGSITAAPLLLVLGYVVLLPLAISG